MSRILELILCALVPLLISAFSVPRDVTPDDELNAVSESRVIYDEDFVSPDFASEGSSVVEDSDRSA